MGLRYFSIAMGAAITSLWSMHSSDNALLAACEHVEKPVLFTQQFDINNRVMPLAVYSAVYSYRPQRVAFFPMMVAYKLSDFYCLGELYLDHLARHNFVMTDRFKIVKDEEGNSVIAGGLILGTTDASLFKKLHLKELKLFNE